MRELLPIVSILAALPLIAAGRPKHYYQPIIDAAPFGAMAPDPPALDDTPVQDPQKVLEESSKIQLCAMTVMPDGRTAVGLIDNDGSQPSYLVLFDSDSSNGLKLIFSDYDREIATFERDGTMFTLQLGLGLVETITPALLEAREAEAAQLAAEEQSRRPPPNSLAEQLIAMQLSLPPDVEAPPLPIPIGDAEMFTRKFDPDRDERIPETETEALVQAGVSELHQAVAAGESPQEYLRRLTEHRQKEVERQQAEKKQAQEALDAELAAGGLAPEDEDYIRRRTNIELMKKGVVPLSPVNDLTDDEIAEIDAALSAPDTGAP